MSKQEELSSQEKLEDLIYKTLKEDEITTNIGERAYITDILSDAIIKAGYMVIKPLVKEEE